MIGSSEAARDDGFSLIELLIVIIVLGLLAAIVVFGVGSVRENAVANACRTYATSIELSAEAVKVKTDAYPAGTLDATTASNPLVEPEPGALLKTWPASPDFVLRYVGSGGTSYSVDVYRADGTTAVAGCDAL